MKEDFVSISCTVFCGITECQEFRIEGYFSAFFFPACLKGVKVKAMKSILVDECLRLLVIWGKAHILDKANKITKKQQKKKKKKTTKKKTNKKQKKTKQKKTKQRD